VVPSQRLAIVGIHQPVMNSSLDDENQKEEAAELILRVSLLCLNRDIPEAIFKIILKMPFLGFET
jgi:hypothetical protein